MKLLQPKIHLMLSHPSSHKINARYTRKIVPRKNQKRKKRLLVKRRFLLQKKQFLPKRKISTNGSHMTIRLYINDERKLKGKESSKHIFHLFVCTFEECLIKMNTQYIFSSNLDASLKDASVIINIFQNQVFDMNNLTIGFIGFGLIGGSIARGLRSLYPASRLVAYNSNPEHTNPNLLLAKEEHTLNAIVSSFDEEFPECDLIFLCAPVLRNISYLPELKKIMKEDCILTDVGRVKGNIHQAI